MQAVRQIVDAEKLCQIMDMPENMRHMQVEVIVFPLVEFDPRAEAKKAIKELQQQSIINETSDMTMEEIDTEIALYRKEKASRNCYNAANGQYSH
jgi:hypothetical protein